MQKKVEKIFFFCLKQISKCDTCFTPIFQGLFKNIIFRSVALVIKKVEGYLRFFLHTKVFLSPCTHIYIYIYI